MRRRELLGLALAAFAAAGCDKLLPGSATPFNGVDITGSDLGPDFRLTDHNGTPRSLADFRGKTGWQPVGREDRERTDSATAGDEVGPECLVAEAHRRNHTNARDDDPRDFVPSRHS